MTIVTVATIVEVTGGLLTKIVVNNRNDGRAGNDVRVSGSSGAGGENDVILTSQDALGNDNLVGGSFALVRRLDGTGGGDEVRSRRAVSLGCGQSDGGAGLQFARLYQSQGREGFEGKRRTTLGTASDEHRCHGVDLVEIEGNVEGGREW